VIRKSPIPPGARPVRVATADEVHPAPLVERIGRRDSATIDA
jgi:hypothetical protein